MSFENILNIIKKQGEDIGCGWVTLGKKLRKIILRSERRLLNFLGACVGHPKMAVRSRIQLKSFPREEWGGGKTFFVVNVCVCVSGRDTSVKCCFEEMAMYMMAAAFWCKRHLEFSVFCFRCFDTDAFLLSMWHAGHSSRIWIFVRKC